MSNTISVQEKEKIFVTMNATFKNEETCRVAMETIVKDAHAAYGVNSHFWFISKDRKSLFVLEQYEDKRALRQAIRRFTSARISFFRSIEVVDVSIYGDVSWSSKLMFAALRPNYMKYFGGYSRNGDLDQESGIQDFQRDRIVIASRAEVTDQNGCVSAMNKIVGDSYAGTGINSHFWFQSSDGKALMIFEQYEHIGALVDNKTSIAPLHSELCNSVAVSGVRVYGDLNDQSNEILAPVNSTSMNYYGGYSK